MLHCKQGNILIFSVFTILDLKYLQSAIIFWPPRGNKCKEKQDAKIILIQS